MGYVWTCISNDAVFYHADKSRAGTVLDLYFPYWDIPITVDGYAAYNRFKTIQRCPVPHTARCRVCIRFLLVIVVDFVEMVNQKPCCMRNCVCCITMQNKSHDRLLHMHIMTRL